MAVELTWPGKESVAAYVRDTLAAARAAPATASNAASAPAPDMAPDMAPDPALSERLGWRVLPGDNHVHLAALAAELPGRFDLVYLDPPYNCGYRLFAYDDTSSDASDHAWLKAALGTAGAALDQRERWLNLMYGRLLLTAELLSGDAVVVASIDSCEVSRLSLLLEEVCGDRRPLRTFCWPHSVQPTRAEQLPRRLNYLLIAAPPGRGRAVPTSVLGSTAEGRRELAAELGVPPAFDTPKPQRLLRHLVSSYTTKDSLVLDPYAGSGGMGVAVADQNRMDAGNRICVLIERTPAAVGVLLERGKAALARLDHPPGDPGHGRGQ